MPLTGKRHLVKRSFSNGDYGLTIRQTVELFSACVSLFLFWDRSMTALAVENDGLSC